MNVCLQKTLCIIRKIVILKYADLPNHATSVMGLKKVKDRTKVYDPTVKGSKPI